MRNLLKNFPLALMQPLLRWQVISDGDEGPRRQGASRAATGGTAMAFKVGDAVRLKSGGAQMIVSKLFKSPEGSEMVQCTWFDKKPREHRAAFVMDSLEVAEATTRHLKQGERA
jgi:uncharacterized protein YodC (DUF2158 family)